MKKKLEELMQYRFLLAELVKKGVRLKYRRSYLGIIWSLLEPLMMTAVLTIVFSNLFGRTGYAFPVYVLTGRLLYSYFSTGTKGALKSIQANSAMIKKVYVPKFIYPLSSILFNYVIFLISLTVLIVLCAMYQVWPTIYLLQIFVPLILLLLLSYGCGMILATVAVFFRDMEYLWNIALMVVMYTCAIFYPAERLIKNGNGWLLKINPLYAIIHIFRNAIFGEPMDLYYLAYATIFSILSVVVGIFIFRKKQDNFILHL
jgi:ABC-2 type transport system permease protein